MSRACGLASGGMVMGVRAGSDAQGWPELLDRDGAIFVAFFDQHDGDVFADRVFAVAAGFLADQPLTIDELQAAGIGSFAAGFATDAMWAAQNVK